MSSSKKDSSTSKTAHVMNLLSRRSTGTPKPQPSESVPAPVSSPVSNSEELPEPISEPSVLPSETVPDAPVETAVTTEPAPDSIAAALPRAAQSSVSPFIALMNADAEASAAIKSALEDSLVTDPDFAEPSEEAAESTPSFLFEHSEMEDPASQPSPAFEFEAEVESDDTAPSPAFEFEAEEEPVPPLSSFEFEEHPEEVEDPSPSFEFDEEPEADDEQPAPSFQLEPDLDMEQTSSASAYELLQTAEEDLPYHCINIMQLLVERYADKYIEKFGLCRCQRCKTDVITIALNHLPPKYMVLKDEEISPLASVYDRSYSAELTMQILKACKIVMDSPRHHLL